MRFQPANDGGGPVHQIAAQHESERFLELNYRVANSLQLVSSFLSLQEREAPDPQTKQALHTAASRVAAVGRIQRAVLGGHNRMLDLDLFLRGLCTDLAVLTGLSIEVEAEPIVVMASTAENIAILVSELLLMAAAHDTESEGRTIKIGCRRLRSGDKVTLTVADHGSGPNEGFEDWAEEVGMIILRSTAGLLNGVLTFDDASVAKATLMFPTPRWPRGALYS